MSLLGVHSTILSHLSIDPITKQALNICLDEYQWNRLLGYKAFLLKGVFDCGDPMLTKLLMYSSLVITAWLIFPKHDRSAVCVSCVRATVMSQEKTALDTHDIYIVDLKQSIFTQFFTCSVSVCAQLVRRVETHTVCQSAAGWNHEDSHPSLWAEHACAPHQKFSADPAGEKKISARSRSLCCWVTHKLPADVFHKSLWDCWLMLYTLCARL